MNKDFEQKESYMHLCAKNLLAEKLRQIEKENDFCEFGELSWRHNYGVFTELPFHVSDDVYYFELSAGIRENENGEITGEFDPKFDRGRILFVPDICIFHKGTPKYFIEVVHKHETPQWKIDRINLFFDSYSIEVYEVNAYDILNQVNEIKNLRLKRIL